MAKRKMCWDKKGKIVKTGSSRAVKCKMVSTGRRRKKRS